MPTRKSHSKSRHGCFSCKRRRIKCNEQKPSCSNCVRLKDSCRYALTGVEAAAMGRSLSPRDSHGVSSPGEASTPISSSSQPLLFSLPDEIPNGSPEFCVQDIRLMYHWTTSTSFSFSEEKDVQRVNQIVMPRLAFSHDFLLHAILAISAIHMAFTTPTENNSLWVVGVKHHQLAIGSYRQILGHITPENHEAVFYASALIVLFGIALGNAPDHMQEANPLVRTLDIKNFIFGAKAVVKMGENRLKQSEAIAFLRSGPGDTISERFPVHIQSLEDLKSRIKETLESQEEIDMYSLEIESLGKWYSVAISDPHGDHSLGFLISTHDAFIKEAREEKPIALAIIAHFCVMIHKYRKPTWCTNGWATTLLAYVVSRLDNDWQKLVAWPIQELSLDQGPT